MIERRRPILSAIANRKMFMSGGLATPMPQPTYMDLMPQQMGLPREAQGIMASSQPLVDAIASDANNPYGGDTLSMAQGGAVGFDGGGVALGQAPEAIQIPTVTPTLADQGGSAIFDPANPIMMSPKAIMDETNAERVQRIFPEAAANVGRLTFDQEYPEFERDKEAGRPKSYFTEGAARILQGGRAAVADFTSEVGQDVAAIANVLFGRDTRALVEGASSKEGPSRAVSEIGIARNVAEMIQRRPDAENEIMSLTKRIINNAKADGTELDGQKLTEAVAYGLTTGEREQAIGYDMARRDAERGDVDPGKSTDQGEFGGTPTTIEKPVPILQDDPNLGQEIVPAEGIPVAAADDSDVPRPKEKPPIPQGPFDVEGEIDPDAGLLVETEAPASNAAAPASNAAAQVAKAFDKPMTEPEAKKTIEDYKKRFMEAMPEYEGVSEEEKGYRFIEAGLRVMAGQSPNAIENIATGLKGLGAEFAKDEKEKRAYDRQVDLSASKYALEGIQRDETAAQALAKEKRGLFNKIFVVRKGQSFEYNGKMYNEGDRIIPTVGSLQDGTFPIGSVSSEAFSLEQIKSDRAALKARTERLFKRVESPKNFVKSQTDYINASTQIKANVAISNLLKEAVVPLQAGEVTGGLNALRAFAQRVENFTGLEIPYASETPEAYRDKVGRAITANITSLLNEGNRTVSNADRDRAEEIGGLYANTLLAPTTKNANLLTEKLRAFEEGVQRNNSKNIGIMSGIENAWNGTLNNQLQDYGDILRKSRGDLGSTARRATPGSRRTVRWTDIISVDPDNPSTLSFKPDWFQGK